jgi:L-threonylcarbamoyladenylate synthase
LAAFLVAESDRAAADEAVHVLRSGGLVCYPTDTVYGIGAAAGDDAAVRRLYAVKGRSPDKPLPLLLAEQGDAVRLAEVNDLARTLAGRFWPGPLTIVVRKLPSYRSLALAGHDTVALRVPDHSLVRSIIRTLGEPVTGSSANRAGAPPPATAVEVQFQLGEMVDLIIDGGPCRGRAESTVIDITQDPPRILRTGVVSREELEAVVGHLVGAP